MGEVMTVGRKAVTPVRGRARAKSGRREGWLVTSTPKPPLTCRSTKPGTIQPATSRTCWPAGGDLGDDGAQDHQVAGPEAAIGEEDFAAQGPRFHRTQPPVLTVWVGQRRARNSYRSPR